MNDEWKDWIKENMPRHMQRELWEYIANLQQYREDEIHRLRRDIEEAIDRSKKRFQLFDGDVKKH